MTPDFAVALPAQTQRGMPVVLDHVGKASVLKPFPLTSGKSEAWLQTLIHNYPSLLPVADIEPGLGMPIAVAMEVACSAGFIDNLYLTADGDIIIVEAKLWGNPQARREVVAQVLDYVASLSMMSYEAFEAAALNARGDGASLYSLIPSPPLNEADFIDAVTRNLARARVLAIVLGNGIREEVRALAGLLQSHAGSHFTLALVQISLWADANTGQLVAVPDTLAKTVMIERGIVIVDGGIPKIVPMPVTATAAPAKTMSSELFDEALAKKGPALPGMLRAFIAQLAPFGVFTDQKATLHLLAHVAGYDQPIKLGYIAKNGQLWTDNIIANAPASLGLNYMNELASIIGGQLSTGPTLLVTTNGVSAPNVLDLLSEHAESWYEATAKFLRACEIAAEDSA